MKLLFGFDGAEQEGGPLSPSQRVWRWLTSPRDIGVQSTQVAPRSSFGLLGFHPSALKQPDDDQTKVTNYAHKDFFWAEV